MGFYNHMFNPCKSYLKYFKRMTSDYDKEKTVSTDMPQSIHETQKRDNLMYC